MNMSIAMVEQKIGLPAPAWEGNCYAVACKLLQADLVKGTARYGYWKGPISPGTRFAGREFVQHGWIETPKAMIVDPTRWVFEGSPPYVYEGPNDFYDLAGIEYKKANAKPCPAFDKSAKSLFLPEKGKTRAALDALLPRGAAAGNKVTIAQIHWIATQPPSDGAQLIYKWLDGKKLAGFIPLDFKQLVLGGAPTNL